MNEPYDKTAILVIRGIAIRLLQGWGRVPSDYEVSQALKKAQRLYDESLKVGIPEIEAAPPIVDLN